MVQREHLAAFLAVMVAFPVQYYLQNNFSLSHVRMSIQCELNNQHSGRPKQFLFQNTYTETIISDSDKPSFGRKQLFDLTFLFAKPHSFGRNSLSWPITVVGG